MTFDGVIDTRERRPRSTNNRHRMCELCEEMRRLSCAIYTLQVLPRGAFCGPVICVSSRAYTTCSSSRLPLSAILSLMGSSCSFWSSLLDTRWLIYVVTESCMILEGAEPSFTFLPPQIRMLPFATLYPRILVRLALPNTRLPPTYDPRDHVQRPEHRRT